MQLGLFWCAVEGRDPSRRPGGGRESSADERNWCCLDIIFSDCHASISWPCKFWTFHAVIFREAASDMLCLAYFYVRLCWHTEDWKCDLCLVQGFTCEIISKNSQHASSLGNTRKHCKSCWTIQGAQACWLRLKHAQWHTTILNKKLLVRVLGNLLMTCTVNLLMTCLAL